MAVFGVVPFVHPTIAMIAVGAGLIPVLVHLIQRRRYARVPWAAMTFLLSADRRSARRVRLEQLALLAARVALIVLMGMAIARPYLPASGLIPLGLSGRHHIVLIDNSLSMSAHADGEVTRFDLAKAYADRLIASFPKGDAVSVVTVAWPAVAVVAHPVYDGRLVRRAVSAIAPTQRATDMVGAIAAARKILQASETPPTNRAVHLILDLPRNVWQGETPDSPSPAILAARQLADALVDPQTQLNVVSVVGGEIGFDGGTANRDATVGARKDSLTGEGVGERSSNVALTGLRPESLLLGVHFPVRIAAEVTNFGTVSVGDLTLEFRRDGRIIRRQELPVIEPGASTHVTILTEFSTSGTHIVEARVSGSAADALSVDDARRLSIEVPRATRVLLVDGRPGATPLLGHAGFVATALSPKLTAIGEANVEKAKKVFAFPYEPKIITEPELSGEALPEYGVLVLCNVERLSPRQWAEVVRFVSNGGGLLIFAGDLISAESYNRYGYADGAGLLPGRIGRMARQLETGAEDAGGVTTGGGSDQYTSFKLETLPHPIVAELADLPTSGLFLARVHQYLVFDLDPNRAQIVLRYTDGKPAMVASSFGRGRVVVCTTTANMDWTNLPAKGDYVSLMLNTVAFLSPPRGVHRNIIVGHSLIEPVSAVQSSLPARVLDGGGGTALEQWHTAPTVVSLGNGLALQYGPVERAGALTLRIGSEEVHFAANVDPADCDLRAVRAEDFATLLDRPVNVISELSTPQSSSARARSSELALVALLLVAGLLFVEMWMAMRFGRMANVE